MRMTELNAEIAIERIQEAACSSEETAEDGRLITYTLAAEGVTVRVLHSNGRLGLGLSHLVDWHALAYAHVNPLIFHRDKLLGAKS